MLLDHSCIERLWYSSLHSIHHIGWDIPRLFHTVGSTIRLVILWDILLRYFKPISQAVLWDGAEANIPHHPIPFRPLVALHNPAYILGRGGRDSAVFPCQTSSLKTAGSSPTQSKKLPNATQTSLDSVCRLSWIVPCVITVIGLIYTLYYC